MFRILVLILTAALIFLLVSGGSAETITSNMQGRLGVGGGVSLNISPGVGTYLYITPQIIYGLGPNFYLQGELGIYSYSPGGGSFDLFITPCYNFTPQKQSGLYAGVMVGYRSWDSTFMLEPLGGIQYFLTRNLALDGYVGILFTGAGGGTEFEARVKVNCYLR